MLVITRKVFESFKIGDQITVTVTRIKGDAVRIGIEAPKDVNIVRSELTSPPADGDTHTERPNHAT